VLVLILYFSQLLEFFACSLIVHFIIWLVVLLSKFGIRFYALWPSLVCILRVC